MKEKFAKLIDVKSLVTLGLVVGYIGIAVTLSLTKGQLIQSYDTTLGIALGFYFCNQTNKKRGE